jgi:hypothetical protein
MKKIFIAIVLFFLVPQLNFAQENTSTGDPTVYITSSGSKYHSSGCSYLSKSSIEKKLSEVTDSYSACSRCIGSSSSNSSTKQNFSGGSSSETTKSGATIHTGPRGGKYYYNKNGKKTYVRKKK